ncbi:MAG: exodeoxyribonuclease VII large subunit [Oscillospiraceae bacterium]
MNDRIYKVSELNEHIKLLIDDDPELAGVYVRGELSNYKVYPSGHHYFTMKDETGALRCVMFKNSAMRLKFRPESGMKVIAFGRVAVYPRDGAYQLYVNAITPDGVGDLQMAFEQLKEKLFKEGLFDKEHKKPIPRYPMRIGVVTSSAGAAVHDIIRVLRKRWPAGKILLLPVRVQGEEAPPEIVGAIRYANRHKVSDVLIVGRGGGSIEDLWAFNDERVARAIYDSEIPVISAVGHEPDVTISDFVADLRAATPSNAAELCAPDSAELSEYIASAGARSKQAIDKKLALYRQQLKALSEKRALQDPRNYIDDRRINLDHLSARLASAAGAAISARREQFAAAAGKLDALSPLKVLGRGYAIARRSDGTVIKSASDVRPGDNIRLRLKTDEIECTVRQSMEVK